MIHQPEDNHEQKDTENIEIRDPQNPLHKLCKKTGDSIGKLVDHVFMHPSSWRPLFIYMLFYCLLTGAFLISVITCWIGMGTVSLIGFIILHNDSHVASSMSIGNAHNVGTAIFIPILYGITYWIAYLYRKYQPKSDYTPINH